MRTLSSYHPPNYDAIHPHHSNDPFAQGQNKFTIEIPNTITEGGHIKYLIKVSTPDNTSFTIKRRYREIRELHENLKCTYPTYLLPFPAKRYFRNTDPQFIRERRRNLQTYFSGLMKLQPICDSIFVKTFLSTDNSCNIPVKIEAKSSEVMTTQQIDSTVETYTTSADYLERRSIDSILSMAKLQMIDLALPLYFSCNPVNNEQTAQRYDFLLNFQHSKKPIISLPKTENDYYNWSMKAQSKTLTFSPNEKSFPNRNPHKTQKTSLFKSFLKRLNDPPQLSLNSTNRGTTSKIPPSPLLQIKDSSTSLLATPLDPYLFNLSQILTIPKHIPSQIQSVTEVFLPFNFPQNNLIEKKKFIILLNQLVEAQTYSNTIYNTHSPQPHQAT